MNKNEKIAILFFSRTPEAESGKWSNFDQSSQVFAQSLYNHSLSVLKNTALPIYHSHEGNQSGDTFGEKLANAFEHLFNLGFESVIAVGNDSPEIQYLDWQRIRKQIEENKCVLGPSLRGGAYLIGLNRQRFIKKTFIELPWKKSSLFRSLKEYCGSGGPLELLPAFRDFNTIYDLKKGVESAFLPVALKKLIIHIIRQCRHWNSVFSDKISFNLNFFHRPLRAPPAGF